jgi:hypothetical protein
VFPPGADPADLLRLPGGRGRIRAALERDARPSLRVVLEHQLDQMLGRYPRMLYEVEGRTVAARTLAPLIAEQPPPAAVAAVRDLARYVRSRTPAPDADRVAGELVHSLTLAVSRYLDPR